MSKRFLSVVVFAILISAVASLVIYKSLVARFGTASRGKTPRLVVASRDLQVGTMLRDTDVTLADWSGPMPPQAVLRTDQAVGRGVIASIYTGEPVLESRLAVKGAGAGLAALIPKGMRAVAVKVDEVVGVAGFVVPGMRVDVLISGVPPGNRANEAGPLTRTILQNIEVLSAGQNIQKDAEGKPISVQVVNLLVSPDQAETLSLASRDAKIQLVLRNPLDTDQAKTPGAELARLFGHAAPPTPPAKAVPVRPAPKPVQKTVEKKAEPVVVRVKIVEVFSGGKRTEVKLNQSPEVVQ